MNQLMDRANLFDVIVPEFKHIKICRKELALLKVSTISKK